MPELVEGDVIFDPSPPVVAATPAASLEDVREWPEIVGKVGKILRK